MKAYNCEICNFSSNLKSDLKRHLNTKKHINNAKELGDKKEEICKIYSKNPPKPSKMKYEPPKSLQNSKKVYVCESCGNKVEILFPDNIDTMIGRRKNYSKEKRQKELAEYEKTYLERLEKSKNL